MWVIFVFVVISLILFFWIKSAKYEKTISSEKYSNFAKSKHVKIFDSDTKKENISNKIPNNQKNFKMNDGPNNPNQPGAAEIASFTPNQREINEIEVPVVNSGIVTIKGFTEENIEEKLGPSARVEYGNGDIYIGETENGSRNGVGLYFHKNTDGKYFGEWLSGNREGFGVYHWTKTERYEGAWVKGIRTGYGKYFYSNGDYYEGDFVENQLQGYGKYIYANGVINEGQWENGHFVV